jgi:hypothetical protein
MGLGTYILETGYTSAILYRVSCMGMGEASLQTSTRCMLATLRETSGMGMESTSQTQLGAIQGNGSKGSMMD